MSKDNQASGGEPFIILVTVAVVVVSLIVGKIVEFKQAHPYQFWGGVLTIFITILIIVYFMYLRPFEEIDISPVTSKAGYTPKELSSSQPTEPTIFDEVVTTLRNYTPMRNYSDERQYQIDIASYLRGRFEKVKIEQGAGSGAIDITVGYQNEIGIELKVLRNKGDLDRTIGQLLGYVDKFDEVVLLMFNQNVAPQEIGEFRDKLMKIPGMEKVEIILK